MPTAFETTKCGDNPTVLRSNASAQRPEWSIALRKRSLRAAALFRRLDSTQLAVIARAGQGLAFASGETICREGDPGDSLFVVLGGRVRVSVKQLGGEVTLGHLDQGEHFGEMCLLMNGRRTASVTAATDAFVLRIDRDTFDKVSQGVPELWAELSKTLAQRLHHEQRGGKRAAHPKVVGVFYASRKGHDLAAALGSALESCGEAVDVLADNDWPWRTGSARTVRRVPAEPGDGAQAAAYRELVDALPQTHRVLVARSALSEARRPLFAAQCETLLWVVEPDRPEHAIRPLRELLSKRPDLAPRVHLVWLLCGDQAYAPAAPAGVSVAPRSFKVSPSDRVGASRGLFGD